MRTAKILAILAIAVLILPAARGQGAQVKVAAAADLTFALAELAPVYESQTHNKLRIVYGSSGNFFSQIQNGAPFDVFLSADVEFPARLQAAGLTEPGTLHKYAIGEIALWAPADSRMDLSRQTWKALTDASVQKIAIANPAACTVRASGDRSAEASGNLRPGRVEAGLRRKRFAGSAVRAIGKRAGRNPRVVPGPFPADEVRTTLGDSGRHASADRTSCRRLEARAPTNKRLELWSTFSRANVRALS